MIILSKIINTTVNVGYPQIDLGVISSVSVEASAPILICPVTSGSISVPNIFIDTRVPHIEAKDIRLILESGCNVTPVEVAIDVIASASVVPTTPIGILGQEYVDYPFISIEESPDDLPRGEYIELPKETRKDYFLDSIYLYLTKRECTEDLPRAKTRTEVLLETIYKALIGESGVPVRIAQLRTVEEFLLYNWLCYITKTTAVTIPLKRLREEEDFWLYEILDNLGNDTYIPPSYLKDNTSLEVLRYSLISKLL